MSQIQGLEYPDVAEALRRASISVDAADCHGLFCGLICAAGFADQKIWVAEIFEAYDPKDLLQAEAYRLLQRLYEETLIRLNSPELDFEPLLPDDEDPLCDRTESLANWCGGFLSGLGMGGVAPQAELPDEVADAVKKKMGTPVSQGYGLTETTATVSVFPDNGFQFGTVGFSMPDIEVKIGYR